MDGFAEVEHGRLATENGSAAEVKQFGQRMVDDH
jgi:predicted outer membrane protein